jgi:enoyl-CoA hydratase/carnithine racemase
MTESAVTVVRIEQGGIWVAKVTHFEDYRNRYPNFRMEKSDEQILLVQMHTNGGELFFDTPAHDAMSDVFEDIAGDRDLSCVILTGTGDTFIHHSGLPGSPGPQPANIDLGADLIDLKGYYGRTRHMNVLEIQVPMIAAVNGPCSIHSELAVLCDIVLASDDAYFQDLAHFTRGLVPGDGVHTVWPRVIGHNRARYFLLTGQKLSAQQALEYGAVNEVLPKADLMDRAWELARYLALRPPITLRSTRSVLIHEFKRDYVNNHEFGQFQELLGMRNFFTWRGGKQPLDRPWNDNPWDDATPDGRDDVTRTAESSAGDGPT